MTCSMAAARVPTAARFVSGRREENETALASSLCDPLGREGTEVLDVVGDYRPTSLLAISRRLRSLFPARSSRSATATTSWPAGRSQYCDLRGQSSHRPAPSPPQRPPPATAAASTSFVFGFVELDLFVDFVAVFAVVGGGRSVIPVEIRRYLAVASTDPSLSRTVAIPPRRPALADQAGATVRLDRPGTGSADEVVTNPSST